MLMVRRLTYPPKSEPDPLQHVLDRAIEFKSLFQNAEEKIFRGKRYSEEHVKWDPTEAL